MAKVLLLILCWLLSLVTAQYKCNIFTLTLDYKMDHTFIVGADLALTSVSIELKFHKVDQRVLLAQFSISDTLYNLYYFPRASQICLGGTNKGVILLNVPYGAMQTFQLSAAAVTVSGTTLGFNSSLTECDGTSHLQPGPFLNNVAQLKIDATSAITTFASVLSTFTELVDETCEDKVAVCTQCVQGYYPNAGSCDVLQYGCADGIPGSCMYCRSGFTYDSGSSKCVGGTGAFASQNSLAGQLSIPLNFGTASWTVQFYLMLLPESAAQVAVVEPLLKFHQGLEVPQIQFHYDYAYSPSVNSLQLRTFLDLTTGQTQSDTFHILPGDWVFVTFEANQVLSSYSLDGSKQPPVSIYGQAHILPTSLQLLLNSNSATIYLKEVLVWNSAISDTPEIASHQCQFSHGAAFSPLAQFDLNFTPLSTETQIIDTQGAAAPTNINLQTGQTVASLIESLQPVAQLGPGLTPSSLSGSPACVRCTPGCSDCFDIFICTTCSWGTLKAGLCIAQTLVPSSGSANSTLFSFNSTDFTEINAHITRQL